MVKKLNAKQLLKRFFQDHKYYVPRGTSFFFW